MCDLNQEQMAKAIPLVLKGNEFRLYANNKHRAESYAEGIRLIRGWYTSEEKQTRLLYQWNRMTLYDTKRRNPYMSEVEDLKDFTNELMPLQQQYH